GQSAVIIGRLPAYMMSLALRAVEIVNVTITVAAQLDPHHNAGDHTEADEDLPELPGRHPGDKYARQRHGEERHDSERCNQAPALEPRGSQSRHRVEHADEIGTGIGIAGTVVAAELGAKTA